MIRLQLSRLDGSKDLLQVVERSRGFVLKALHLTFELPDSPFDYPRILWPARRIQVALFCSELTFKRHEFAYGISDDSNESLMTNAQECQIFVRSYPALLSIR